MEQNNRDLGKGLAVGSLLAAALVGVLKLMDRHFARKHGDLSPQNNDSKQWMQNPS